MNAAPPPTPDRIRVPEILIGEILGLGLIAGLIGAIVVMRRQRAARDDIF